MTDIIADVAKFDDNGIEKSQLQDWDQKHFMHPWAEISPTVSFIMCWYI